MVKIREIETDKAAVCEPILRALPQWFGIEAALQDYVRDIARMRTWVAELDDAVAGFVTAAYHNAFTAELHVMGVRAEVHRRGVGRALVARLEAELRAS